MKKLVGTAAIAAALALTTAPAMAQSLNFSADAPVRVRLDSGFLPDPHEVQVEAGGPLDASATAPDCIGQVSRRATVSLRYTAGTLPLIISAVSEADTTLVVRAPDGSWTCNDDYDGLDPQVSWANPQSGRYQVWVGRFAINETAPATLRISEIAESSSGDLPDYSLDPAYGGVSLAAGFMPDPYRQEILAGGELDASVIGPGCVGHVARAPDFRVQWTAGSGGRPLIFSVSSEADTTLVVNDSEGNWHCDDDSGNRGLNPSISLDNPQSGQYDIWVGTYSEGALQQSTLNISGTLFE
ncbi:MAG: hypothetical protein R3C16_04490 [Hyphomonadaceae bacterium]